MLYSQFLISTSFLVGISFIISFAHSLTPSDNFKYFSLLNIFASNGTSVLTKHFKPFVCASISTIPSPSNNDGNTKKSNVFIIYDTFPIFPKKIIFSLYGWHFFFISSNLLPFPTNTNL